MAEATMSRAQPGPHADCAVVFGGPVRTDGAPIAMVRNRVHAACQLWHAGRVRKLILTGTRAEADAMCRLGRELGVSDGDLILETTSCNTPANVQASLAVMEHHGLRSALAVSQAWHLPRIKRLYASAGRSVPGVPADDAPGRFHRLWWLCRELLAQVATHFGLLPPRYEGKLNFAVQPEPLAHPRVEIDKSAGRLRLYDGRTMVGTYAVITGKAAGDKQVEGDRKTPIGQFYVCSKNPNSEYHLALGLSYPSAEDAARGLAAGLITQPQHDLIIRTIANQQSPPWDTPLGGQIMIHGQSPSRAGTAGCIAMSNRHIQDVYRRVPLGTAVVIRL